MRSASMRTSSVGTELGDHDADRVRAGVDRAEPGTTCHARQASTRAPTCEISQLASRPHARAPTPVLLRAAACCPLPSAPSPGPRSSGILILSVLVDAAHHLDLDAVGEAELDRASRTSAAWSRPRRTACRPCRTARAPRGSRAPASSRRARCRRSRCSSRGSRRPACASTAALISNWIAPSISLPLGAMYSSLPSSVSFSIAPTLIVELHALLDLARPRPRRPGRRRSCRPCRRSSRPWCPG